MSPRSTIRQRFTSYRPDKQIISRGKKIFFSGLEGVSFHEAFVAFVRQLKKTSITERASGISFNIVMAIPPTLLFLFTLIPYLPISKQFINQMFALIRDVIPGEKNHGAIIAFLRDFLNKPRNELLSFGLFLAILFSSNAMMGVLRSFDKNYPGFSKRKMLQKRRVALQLTLICFFLIFLCILLLVAQSAVLKWVGIRGVRLRAVLENLRWVLVILLTFYIVSHIYRHGPAVKKKWPLLTPGSVLATTLMIIATALVTYYVNHFSNYNKLYGSIGAIFILMSLIYANSLALMMGFELNVTLDHLRQKKQTSLSNGSDHE
jgi:membrane protein